MTSPRLPSCIKLELRPLEWPQAGIFSGHQVTRFTGNDTYPRPSSWIEKSLLLLRSFKRCALELRLKELFFPRAHLLERGNFSNTLKGTFRPAERPFQQSVLEGKTRVLYQVISNAPTLKYPAEFSCKYVSKSPSLWATGDANFVWLLKLPPFSSLEPDLRALVLWASSGLFR